jgi:hypothetical protein
MALIKARSLPTAAEKTIIIILLLISIGCLDR